MSSIIMFSKSFEHADQARGMLALTGRRLQGEELKRGDEPQQTTTMLRSTLNRTGQTLLLIYA